MRVNNKMPVLLGKGGKMKNHYIDVFLQLKNRARNAEEIQTFDKLIEIMLVLRKHRNLRGVGRYAK